MWRYRSLFSLERIHNQTSHSGLLLLNCLRRGAGNVSHELCAACNVVEFDDLFNPQNDERKHYCLRTWDEIKRETECSFCDPIKELITATLVIHPEQAPRGSEEMIIVGRSSLHESLHKDSSTSRKEDSRKVAIVYVGIAKHPKLPETLHQLCLLAEEFSPNRPLYQGRLVRQKQANFSIVNG